MPLFCVTGGGTLGHVSPNLVLATALKKKDQRNKILYIGSKEGIEKDLVSEIPYIQYHPITTGKLRRYFSRRNLFMPVRVVIGFIEAVFLLCRYRPCVVFSSGGYVGFPVIVAASCLRIPVVTYDADITMGLANKVGSIFAHYILCGFEPLYEKLLDLRRSKVNWRSKKIIYSGPFIREEFNSVNPSLVREMLGFNDQKPVLLIFGGSLGSNFINEMAKKTYERLLWHFQIIHISGRNKMVDVESADGYVVKEFVTGNFSSYMALADVIVSRAGATSIFEMLYLRKPHVLIPLSKKVSRGDQELNAEYFARKGVSVVLHEHECDECKFYDAILDVFRRKEDIAKAIDNSGVPDAVEVVTALFDDIVKNKKSCVK